jgi:hypothetical protein
MGLFPGQVMNSDDIEWKARTWRNDMIDRSLVIAQIVRENILRSLFEWADDDDTHTVTISTR